MRVAAIWTIKGGVGKTAAAVNLAWLCAREGHRTLLWDLDPQGAATFYFRVKPRVAGGGRELLRKSTDLSDLVQESGIGTLDVLPADASYGRLDLDLDARKDPAGRIALKLAPLARDYDWVFLDCPPSVSLTSEAVLRASDALLVPVVPTTLSTRALEQVRAFAAGAGRKGLAVLPFLSMVDRRKTLHNDTVEACRREGDGFLKAVIRCASVVERMGVHLAPVGAFAPASDAAEEFEELWREVRARVEGAR